MVEGVHPGIPGHTKRYSVTEKAFVFQVYFFSKVTKHERLRIIL